MWNRIFEILSAAFVLFLVPGSTAFAQTEVAITIDDLPHVIENVKGADQRWVDISKEMLAAFDKHQLKGVYGFLNAIELTQDPSLREVLDLWVAAGQKLGSHTFSHPALTSTSVEAYEADILKNEAVLNSYLKPGDTKYFRFPFLEEGNTLEKRNLIRDFLKAHDYKTAQVTFDDVDWKFNDKYVAAMQAKNTAAMQSILQQGVKKALSHLADSQQVARKIFGRDIRHIILLHMTPYTAAVMDALLTAFENQGIRVISLDEAMQDPLYSNDPSLAYEHGLTFVEQCQGFAIP